jgi:hypothetical protein
LVDIDGFDVTARSISAREGADVDYVILIRDNPYHRPQEILEHELRHIARGDL